MDFQAFSELTDYIMEQTGLDEDKASDFAEAMGDTPDQTEDGKWTATIDGETITIDPPR